jgi:hypothetical protein
MSLTGHVENGVVVFDSPASLPDGTVVDIAVRPVEAATHYDDRCKKVIAAAKGAPDDFAERVGGMAKVERLPDDPWLDVAFPAPFDLPRPGVPERVQPRHAERLPELPSEIAETPL